MARGNDDAAHGEIRTRRWNDRLQHGDGTRVLICRWRPRGVRKADETWDEWRKVLAPSADLVAAFYGKHAPPIGWTEYRRRYHAEMTEPAAQSEIAALGTRVATGETITILCSSACVDETRCHRRLLRDLIGKRLRRSTGSRRPK